MSLTLAFFAGCHHEEGKKEEKPRPPVHVRTAKVEKRTLQPSFRVIGTVQADPERVATLTAAIPGVVDLLAVKEGQRVKKGELLVQLDDRKAQTDLDRAETAYKRLIAPPRPEEVSLARSAVEKAKAGLAVAAGKVERSRAVRVRSPELVPEVQLVEEQRAQEIAHADVDTAEAQARLVEKGARAELRQEAMVEVKAAKLQVEFCRVLTPLAGDVVELKARIGQRADVGTAVATVLDSSEVIVQARIPANRLKGVLQAMQAGRQAPLAIVHSPSFPEETFTAVTGWLGRQTELTTSDVPVHLRTPNPKGLLRVGMTVDVKLLEAPVEGLAIPDTAFTVNEEGKQVVTTIHDGKAKQKEIELFEEGGSEVRADGWIRVLKGLDLGEEVAVENGYGLPDDCPVEVDVAKAEAKGDDKDQHKAEAKSESETKEPRKNDAK